MSDAINSYPNAIACKHGQLARSCNICELEAERDAWKSMAEKLALAAKTAFYDEGTKTAKEMMEDLEKTLREFEVMK